MYTLSPTLEEKNVPSHQNLLGEVETENGVEIVESRINYDHVWFYFTVGNEKVEIMRWRKWTQATFQRRIEC